MSDLFKPARPGEIELDRHLQESERRMGSGFVVAHEKPTRDMTLLGGKPVALPWSTGKPLGHQMSAFGGVERVIEDGQVTGTRLTFQTEKRDIYRLNASISDAETLEMVNSGV